MKAKYQLIAEPGLTGYKLREDHQWECEFSTIPQAMSFVRTLPESEHQKVAVLNSSGNKVAEMTV